MFFSMQNQLFNDNDVKEYLERHPDAVQLWLNRKHPYNYLFKRLPDFVLAALLIILLLPLYFIIGIAIKMDSSGPIFYRGLRGAYHGESFRIFKFRSMVNGAERLGGGTTALNDERITKIGTFLRKTKLDEIPQLFNILLGDMSFVGPRPELLQYTENYRGAEKLILQVRPGLTDVSSLNFISLDEIVGCYNADEVYERMVLERKNLLRIGYVLFQSPILDIKLFCLTLFCVVKRLIVFVGRL